jgi:hypothetical protein
MNHQIFILQLHGCTDLNSQEFKQKYQKDAALLQLWMNLILANLLASMVLQTDWFHIKGKEERQLARLFLFQSEAACTRFRVSYQVSGHCGRGGVDNDSVEHLNPTLINFTSSK